MFSRIGSRRAGRLLCLLTLFTFTLQWLAPVAALAQPAPRRTAQATPSQRKKPRPGSPDQRVEQLERQLEQQQRQLQELQKQLEELRRERSQASPSPAPSTPPASPSPAPPSPSGSPAVPSPEASPSPAAPGSEPAPPGETPGPMIDETVPRPAGPPGTAEPPPAPGPGTSPSPGAGEAPGPVLDETVPPPGTTPGGSPPGGTPPPASNALNPDISAIGLFEARTSNDKQNDNDNKLSVREVELSLQGRVDPFARYDLFLALHDGESIEVEEGYGTFLRLPLDFQGKMGKFLAAFGRNNELHTHAYPQIDRPLVIQQFLGQNGLSGVGVGLSNILPVGWYSEFIAQGFMPASHGHSGEGETTEAHLSEPLLADMTKQKPAWLLTWRNLFDLREDLTAELGLSGVYAKNDMPEVYDTRLAGASLTLKYRPLRRLGQFGITWETEYLTSRQRIPVVVPQATEQNPDLPPLQTLQNRTANGWYSYLEIQPHRNWIFNVRYDRTHLPLDPDKIQEGWSALIGYRFSEFNQVRLQFSRYHRNWDQALQQLFFQWNISIGPHGTHRY